MAGAAFLAGSGTASLRAQTLAANTLHDTRADEHVEETAMAVPRLAPRGGGSVGLPHPLSAEAAARVRQIFRLQRQSDFPAAQAALQSLDDETLLPDLLAARYLSSGYQATPGQLRLWLKNYSVLADAPAIHDLLVAASSKGAIPAMAVPAILARDSMTGGGESIDPSQQGFTRNPMLDRTIRERLGQGVKGARSALYLVRVTPGISDLYAAQLRAEIALSLLSGGESALALSAAQDAVEQSGGRLGFASFVAGLCAWQRGRADMALPWFEEATRAPLTSVNIRAASAFWSARAHQRIGDMAAYEPWLHRAAAAPRTFYGMLAAQSLGIGHFAPPAVPVSAAIDETPVRSRTAVMGEIDVEAVAATPAGRHLFALLQVGEQDRAEAAIRRMWPDIRNDAALCRSVQLVAEAAGLDDLARQMASILDSRDEDPAHADGFPLPHLVPRHGFRMNPALVYAITRLESNFDPSVTSGAGARGLMQLMSVTANFVVHHTTAHTDTDVSAALLDPATNLEIGQLFVLYLAEQSRNAGDSTTVPAGGNLIRMLASYNAGPSAIARWESQRDSDGDPLMFIEMLPNTETRDYVHNALTYLWIYGRKMHMPTPSLTALSQNEWPSFASEAALAGHKPTIH